MLNLVDTYQESQWNIEYGISHSFQFWLYFTSNVLSVLCCYFVLFHLLFDRTLRSALENHCITILVIICLMYESIDIPFLLYGYYFEKSWQTTSISYRFWSFSNIGLYTSELIILAWATIDRHIIAFHYRWLSKKEIRFYIHYFPLILLISYCLLWHSMVILIPSCIKIHNQSSSDTILYPCIFEYPIIKYFDVVCHQIIPSFVITICSLLFLFRVRWQKSQFNPLFDRIKQRKMIFEILSISILHFIFCGPWTLVIISFQFGFLEYIFVNFVSYAFFSSHYFIVLFPFICCALLPELPLKFKKFLCCKLQNL